MHFLSPDSYTSGHVARIQLYTRHYQESFFWLSRRLKLVQNLNSIPDIILFFQKLDLITQEPMLLLVSLQQNKFKQQDLVPLQMSVLLIHLYHWKLQNLWESDPAC